MSEFVTIRTYSKAHEAHLDRTLLEASGIQAIVADEHTVSMNWFYSDAVGGAKLKVPVEYAEQALSILSENATEEVEREYPDSINRCPKCGNKNFKTITNWPLIASLFAIFAFIGVPSLRKKKYHCQHCKTSWR